MNTHTLSIVSCTALQLIATHCNALQRTATHCNTLMNIHTHSIVSWGAAISFFQFYDMIHILIPPTDITDSDFEPAIHFSTSHHDLGPAIFLPKSHNAVHILIPLTYDVGPAIYSCKSHHDLGPATHLSMSHNIMHIQIPHTYITGTYITGMGWLRLVSSLKL